MVIFNYERVLVTKARLTLDDEHFFVLGFADTSSPNKSLLQEPDCQGDALILRGFAYYTIWISWTLRELIVGTLLLETADLFLCGGAFRFTKFPFTAFLHPRGLLVCTEAFFLLQRCEFRLSRSCELWLLCHRPGFLVKPFQDSVS